MKSLFNIASVYFFDFGSMYTFGYLVFLSESVAKEKIKTAGAEIEKVKLSSIRDRSQLNYA